MQNSKYLLANEHDRLWGLTVSTVGYEEIAPGDPYPTKGHAGGGGCRRRQKFLASVIHILKQLFFLDQL